MARNGETKGVSVMDPQSADDIRTLVREELQAQPQTNPFMNDLAGIAGFFAGSTIGLGAVDPLNALKERRLLKQEHRLAQQAMNEQQLYQALREIHLGNATFNDYGESANMLRGFYEDPSIRSMIEDTQSYNRTMQNLKRGNVIDLHQMRGDDLGSRLRNVRKETYKRALPFASGVDAIPKNLMHPAVAIGGLAGSAGAHALLHRKQKNDVE